MILLGAYPQTFGESEQFSNSLADLQDFLKVLAPSSVALHLLPFYPSAGDCGFAPNDWFSVRPEVGTWDDIELLASRRKLVVDGIYNHVGLDHPYAQEFFSAPSTDHDILFAYQGIIDLPCPRAPRGGPVLRSHTIQGEPWKLWQTYSNRAVDINLDNPRVISDIGRHLDVLSDHRVWGVRIDGAAYLAKHLDGEQLHHPDAHRLARRIADMALSRGIAVNAQLNCDDRGLQCFPASSKHDVPIHDYAFTAHLILALMSSRVSGLVKHLKRTWNLPCEIIRSPRTHDGVLLRPRILDESTRKQIVSLAEENDIAVRFSDGTVYEINSSFPYLCSRGVDREDMWRRIELSVAISAIVPGWCYLYLPSIVGHIPEKAPVVAGRDPRSLNRQPMTRAARADYVSSPQCVSMYRLLENLLKMRQDFTKERLATDSVIELGPGLLGINRPSARLRCIANFSPYRTIDIKRFAVGSVIESRQLSDEKLRPLGFVIWRY